MDEIVDQVLNEWCEEKDGKWTHHPNTETFIIDIIYFLDNAKAMGYDLKIPAYHERKEHARKEYPIQEIKKLRREGLSIRKIAKQLKIPKSTIHDILKAQQEN